MGRAIIVGLAAMIGAGVFYVWAPASAAAGTGLLIGLVIAGVIASLNALSSAQLAMAYPVSGGAYAFGRATLGPWWGFSAGWLFLAGKTASAGAIALIAGSYLWPEPARAVAVAAVIVLGAVNMAGIRSTAGVSAAIVFTVLGGLGARPARPAQPDLRAHARAGGGRGDGRAGCDRRHPAARPGAAGRLLGLRRARLLRHRTPERAAERPADRWLPRAIQYAGLAGCLLLAVTLPWPGVLAAAGWLAVGLLARGIRLAAAR